MGEVKEGGGEKIGFFFFFFLLEWSHLRGVLVWILGGLVLDGEIGVMWVREQGRL